MKIYSRLFRNLLVATLNFTLLATTSMVALAAPGNQLSGEIIISGAMVDGSKPSVTVNGENAVSGRTFFSGAVIETPANSTATLNLGKLGQIFVSPNSTLSLTLTENNIGGKLTSGDIQVFNNDGVAINIEKIENGESSVVPSARKDDDDDDKAKKIVPIVLLVGVESLRRFGSSLSEPRPRLLPARLDKIFA